MDEILLIARAVLALVFLTSALTKLVDRGGTRQAIVGFGVSDAIAGPGAVLLPLAELAVAVTLVPATTATWGAAGALGLLLLFIVGISVNLAQGRKPDCNCFGQLHSEPVGASTLFRNTVLAAIAGLVIWAPQGPGPSYVSYLSDLRPLTLLAIISGLVAAGLLALVTWSWWSLLRQHGRLINRVDALEAALASGAVGTGQPIVLDPNAPGLPVGSVAPDFTLSGLYGETLTLQSLLARGKPALLIFTDPGCGPCNELMPDVGQWQASSPNLTIALISRGNLEDNRAKADANGLSNVLLQNDYEVSEAYRYNGTPCATVVGTDGRIARQMACGGPGIRELASSVIGQALPLAASNGNGSAPAPEPVGPAIGEPAPQLSLKNLAGKTVKLTDFKGKDTLLLFWDPGCGFCQNIKEDIKAWEAQAADSAPQLLIVSTSDATSNMAEGFKAPVLLDDGFQTGNIYSAPGTPTAVLIDSEGRIASQVAVGGPAVLELAGAEPASAA